jgi:ADP-heptose:LPS heptosyltransferase
MASALLLDALDVAARRVGRAPDKPPSGVLLVRSGGLGDLILFSHVFPRFKALAAPGETITVLLRGDAAKMAFLLGPGVEVLTVDYGRFLDDLGYRWRTSRQLRDRGFRRVVSTDERRHPLIDEALIAATAAPERWAAEPMAWPKYDRRLARNRALFSRLVRLPDAVHVTEKWAALAATLTGGQAVAPVLRLPDSILPPPATLGRPTVVIQPYAAVAEKQITADDVRRLIETIGPAFDVVITGAPADLERMPAIKALLRPPAIRFDSGTFAEILPLLRAARLVISVDTALLHLAAAAGARTLGLASAAWVGEFVPYPPALTPPGVEFLYHHMPCAGCRAACPYPPENGMYPCVARLDRDLVLAKVRALVQQ